MSSLLYTARSINRNSSVATVVRAACIPTAQCPRTVQFCHIRPFSSTTATPDAAPPSTPAPVRSGVKRPSMKDSSTEAAQRSFALRLYKAIMRAHRTVLPEAMRSLGDTYVREEFKLHKTAKPQHLHGFFTGWIGYLEQMREQGPGAWGKSLSNDQLDALSAEQKSQLELLQKSAAALDDQWAGMERDHNPVTIPSTNGAKQ